MVLSIAEIRNRCRETGIAWQWFRLTPRQSRARSTGTTRPEPSLRAGMNVDQIEPRRFSAAGGASLNFGNDVTRIVKCFEVFQRVTVIVPCVAAFNLLHKLAERIK
jgi:hypothetical protein